MTIAQDLATVVDLACLTADRTRAEQKALTATAKRVDRLINEQTTVNPHLAKGRSMRPGACTYSATHDKKCVCRGDGVAWEPVGGWSRRTHLVSQTWDTTPPKEQE